jgi:magnesium transporter
MRPQKYLKYLYLPNLFGIQRTKEILKVNPTIIPQREEAQEVVVTVHDYDITSVHEHRLQTVADCLSYRDNNRISWINIDGLRKIDVETICNHYNIHPLVIEDILSINQRPKMDEVEDILFCLLNMLYFNDQKKTVEVEQISIVLGKNFVISFQEDATRDVFNPIRTRLKLMNSKIRLRNADYLCYSMLDMIVDNYFNVMEKLGEQIEIVEEEVIRGSNTRSLAKINQLRKELIVLKRNLAPVRDLLNGVIRSESELLEDRTTKYFKDVYDHIVQAYDLGENYRDIMMSMQDLYINNVNLKMNEVMKVMAIVTCLLAPATVIGLRGNSLFTQPLGFFYCRESNAHHPYFDATHLSKTRMVLNIVVLSESLFIAPSEKLFTMASDRRHFLQQLGGLAAGFGTISAGLVSCSDSSSKTQPGNTDATDSAGAATATTPPAKLFFEISLAQWSLHKKLFAKEMDNLDFPGLAKNTYGIGVVEYVNVFFMDKAKDEKYLAELLKRCNDNGVKNHLVMCDDEGELGSPDNKKRNQAVENHYKWVDAAKYLGCITIRVNTFGDGSREDVQKAAIDGLGKLGEYAAKAGINIIVENHGGYTSDGQWMTGVMKGVNKPNVGTLPDFGNFCTKRDGKGPWDGKCIEEYDRYKGVGELMPFAKGVSAKTSDFDDKGNCVETDYSKMLKIVKEAGFHGYMGIEYEGEKFSEDEGIKKTKALLERIGPAIT